MAVWQADSPGEGQGATFTVKLPISAPLDAIVDSTSPPFSQSDGSLEGIRVLVVDDEPDSLDFVAFMLEQAGAEVQTATSGLDALARLPEWMPDILLSDIGMPEMDGYTLIQQIRASIRGSTIPAIALTAYAGEMDARRAKAAGFQQHLAKPVEPELLINTICGLCQQIAREN